MIPLFRPLFGYAEVPNNGLAASTFDKRLLNLRSIVRHIGMWQSDQTKAKQTNRERAYRYGSGCKHRIPLHGPPS